MSSQSNDSCSSFNSFATSSVGAKASSLGRGVYKQTKEFSLFSSEDQTAEDLISVSLLAQSVADVLLVGRGVFKPQDRLEKRRFLARNLLTYMRLAIWIILLLVRIVVPAHDIFSVGFITLVAMLFGASYYVYRTVAVWELDFSKQPSRSQEDAPSHGLRPSVRQRTPDINKSTSQQDYSLDMDHLYLPFSAYVFASFLIIPNLIFLWVKGILILKIREALQRFKIIKPQCCQKRLCAKLLLESVSCVCAYTGQRDGVATFDFPDLLLFKNEEKSATSHHMIIFVDLERKEMVSATWDGKDMSAPDAVAWVCFLIQVYHVKLHAFANWAYPDPLDLNADSAVEIEDACEGAKLATDKKIESSSADRFNRLMVDISVVFNYFGFTGYPPMLTLFYRLGFLRREMRQEMIQVHTHSLQVGIQCHSNIAELASHSSAVNFIVNFCSL